MSTIRVDHNEVVRIYAVSILEDHRFGHQKMG